MARTQQTEQSGKPADLEVKDLAATVEPTTETKASKATDSPEGVKFVFAHPVDKSLVTPGAEGKYEPGADDTVSEHTARHLTNIGAGRRA